ncbi:MAG: cytochrome c peroxidase [Myxococcota bacterium]
MRAALLLSLVACNAIEPIESIELSALPTQEQVQVELGRALFFDPGLSGDGTVSCASCHDPEQFGADGQTTSRGVGGAVGRRNSPSTFNAALKRWQFWDGRADSLEEQARGPLFAADEMAQTPEGLRAVLRERYDAAFEVAFPDEDGPTVAQATRALAAYQRTLPAPSRVDRFLLGDATALSAREQEGLDLFNANCVFCHSGAGVGGTQLEVLGDDNPWPAEQRQDLGRAEVTGRDRDEMVFVVPSLRNVAETAPYFHDGSVETLEEAVRLMGWHQNGRRLPDGEVDALVAFLESLTAEEIPAHARPPADSVR